LQDIIIRNEHALIVPRAIYSATARLNFVLLLLSAGIRTKVFLADCFILAHAVLPIELLKQYFLLPNAVWKVCYKFAEYQSAPLKLRPNGAIQIYYYTYYYYYYYARQHVVLSAYNRVLAIVIMSVCCSL